MATTEPMPTDKTKSFFRRNWYGVLLVAIFIMTLLGKHFIADIYYVPSQSMYPTINGLKRGGDTVFVNKLAYIGSSPHVHDVVVFKCPQQWDQSKDGTILIKRVVAVSGQTIALNDDGQLTVDGVV